MPDNNDSPSLTIDTSFGNLCLQDTGEQTPTKLKESSNVAFKQENPLMKNRYPIISKETAGHYRVGISPKDFFKTFMPWNEKTSKAYKKARLPAGSIEKLKQMAGKAEKDMYGIYHEALNPWTERLKECVPEQTHVINTCLSQSRPPDPYTGSASAAVDMGHYDLSEVDGDAMGETDFSLMQTQVEFKTSAESDPFIDPEIHDDTESKSGIQSKGNAGLGVDVETGASTESGSPPAKRYPNERNTKKATEVRGQIAAYAAITLYLSYRTHLFTVGIFGNYCRFIRWDRRGAVVTRRINYTEKPKLLFEFYRRFAQLTRDGRGFDPTVTRIDLGSEVAKRAEEKFAEYREALTHPQAKEDKPTKASTKRNPSLFKMTVVFDGVERSFIIPSPCFHYGCLSPFSRSTRRSLVYDPAAVEGGKEVFFMKDYWREDSDRTSPEATVYKLLKEKGVTKYVAKMEIGGDIEGLRTRWQEPAFGDFSLFSDPSMMDQKPLQVHRIFLRNIGDDLSAFVKAPWLVGYLADGMQAALDALIKAHVLHRDISAGNIMISRPFNSERNNTQGNGMLIDWDQCIILSEPMPPPRKTRTGTWQFISARILQGDYRSHSHLDDQESAYWVLLYMALRYLKNNLRPDALLSQLNTLFNYRSQHPGGPDLGGDYKVTHFKAIDRFALFGFNIPELVEMFTELADTLSVVYLKSPSDTDLKFVETNQAVGWANLPKDQRKHFDRVDEYNIAFKNRQNPHWFIETLRKHASRISLLSQNSCDFHHNPLSDNRIVSGSIQEESHLSSQRSDTRTHGLTGEPIPYPASTGSKRGTDDPREPQAKKPKLTMGED